MTTAVLAVFLMAALISDLRSRRIPNTLVLGGIAVAFTLHAMTTLSGRPPLAGPAWWSPLAGLGAGFALLLPLYGLRATGAGDVKLMAMVGAFVGAPAVVGAAVYTLAAGGLLALAFMLRPGVAARTLANLRWLLTDWSLRIAGAQGARLAPLPPLAVSAARLPYAAAIAAGTAAALAWPLLGTATGALA